MSKTRETFTTPVGRLVQGDCFEAQTKDQQGNLRVIKTGPNAGQPNPTFFIAVAFAKDNAEFNAFYGMLDRVARLEWPALFPTPGAPCVNPKFAMKVVDGDGLDTNGKSNATKEGFAGHWIVRFASSYAPKVVRPAGNGTWETITDPAAIKRGYFVRIAGSVTGNDNAQNPGLYVNLDMIELAAYGPEIVSGPDAATAFGSAPAVLPAGASATPILGAGLPATGAPALPGTGAPALPGLPAVGSPAVPLAGPALGAASPSLPAVPALPSAPVAIASPTRTMTAAAGGQTYEAFVAAGWSDDLLVSNGYMVVG